MGQQLTTFSGYSVGGVSALTDWSSADAGQDGWSVEEQSGVKNLLHAITNNSTYRRAIRWGGVPTDQTAFDIVAKMRCSLTTSGTNRAHQFIGARVSWSVAKLAGYFLGVERNSAVTGFRLLKATGVSDILELRTGSSGVVSLANITVAAVGVNPESKFWARLSVTSSGVITCKIWQDGAAEPSSPTLTYDDSASPLSAGGAGVAIGQTTTSTPAERREWFEFGVGWGGDPAPNGVSSSTNGTSSGAFPVISSISPAATATGTIAGATDGASSGSVSNVSASSLSATATGTTAGSGTVSIPPITDFGTGTILTGVPNIEADFYNTSTKALVVAVTGLTSHATTGALSVVSASLVAGTTYRTVVEFTYSGHTYRGVWNLVAS